MTRWQSLTFSCFKVSLCKFYSLHWPYLLSQLPSCFKMPVSHWMIPTLNFLLHKEQKKNEMAWSVHHVRVCKMTDSRTKALIAIQVLSLTVKLTICSWENKVFFFVKAFLCLSKRFSWVIVRCSSSSRFFCQRFSS